MYTEKPTKISKPKKKELAADSAMKYLSHRDRTSHEIREYLKKKEYEVEEINEAVNFLKSMNYIDDTDYAVKYLGYAVGKGQGKVKIKCELLKKGIDSDVIDAAILDEELFDKENERARALKQAEKATANLSLDLKPEAGDDYETKCFKYKEQQKLKGKIGRKLMSMGYSQGITISVLNEVLKNFTY